jgi:hypothetical protein
MGSAHSRLAASGALAGFFICFWLFAAFERRAVAGEETKTLEAKPHVFHSVLNSGEKTREIILGRTTYEEVLNMYPAPPLEDYDGALRAAEQVAPAGGPSIKYVYNPWQTMYSIFFDEDKRVVMVSELFELGVLTEKELLRKYPGMVESDSEQGSIEYQAEIEECMTIIANVETASRSVEQLSYAYTCE